LIFELIADEVSKGKSRKVYAKAGELVKVVADFIKVAICEKQNGERFSTLFTNLKQKT
jgi:aspartate 1-decarboxylase